jgi:hypothetical protein
MYIGGEMSKVCTYSQEVWDKVADKLNLSGFSGISFKLISKPGEPFEVEIDGSEQSVKSVLSKGFYSHLRKMIRDEISNMTGGSFISFEKENWPMFRFIYQGHVYKDPESGEGKSSFNDKSSFDDMVVGEGVETETINSIFAVSRGVEFANKCCEILDNESKEPTMDELKDIGIQKINRNKNSKNKSVYNDENDENDEEFNTYVPDMDRLKEIASEIADLVREKNKAYGNSFHTVVEVFSLLYPEGIKIDQIGDMLFLMRIWDKMVRIATNKGAFGENPYNDIVGYALLAAEKYEATK